MKKYGVQDVRADQRRELEMVEQQIRAIEAKQDWEKTAADAVDLEDLRHRAYDIEQELKELDGDEDDDPAPLSG